MERRIEDEMEAGVKEVVRGIVERYRRGEVSEKDASLVIYRCAQYLRLRGEVGDSKGLGLRGMRR